MKKSVYQSESYKKALENSGEKIIQISENYYGIEKDIKIKLLGKKRIIESRGTPLKEDAKKFREKSKEYFYGTIAATVLETEEGMFASEGYQKVTNHTILIDLKKSEDDLWKEMEKKSIRWGVKTGEKNGLSFSEVREENEIQSFYKIYEQTARDGGFPAEKIEFIKEIIKTEISKLFVIKNKDEVIAGGMILIDNENRYSILDLTASTREGLEMQAMPFLYWNLIKYSKDINLEYFDLGGYDREAKQGDKTYNINKFKERFGGSVMEQPIFSTNKKYSSARKIMGKLSFIKKMYKK